MLSFISQRLRLLSKTVSEHDLTPAQRWTVIAVLALAGAAALIVDLYSPGINLAPSAVLFVIAITAVGGLAPGIAAALVAALAFSLAENRSSTTALFGHMALRSVSYLLAVAIVELLRRRGSALAKQGIRVGELERVKAQADLSAIDARYRAVGETLPFGVWDCGPDGHLVHMSASFLNLVGMTLEEVSRGGWLSRVVPEDGERIRAAWHNRDNWRDDWQEEYRILGQDQRMYTVLCRGRKVCDSNGATIGWTGINLDITQQSKARDQLRFLVEAGRLLSLSLNPQTVLERVANLTVPRLADWCAIDVVTDAGEIQPIVVKHADPEKTALARELRAYPEDPARPSATHNVIKTGVSELYADIPDALLRAAAQSERHLALLRELGLRSVLVVPLRARERVLGAMTLVTAESGRKYDQEDVSFAEVLAARSALAYDNARAYAREHHVANTLQRASLPTELPQLPGIRVRATYLPGAVESEVGGDWYDAFVLADGSLALSVGDVAGKGLRAAVAMSAARQAMRTAAWEGSTPRRVLSRLNRLVAHERAGMITAVFGILDPVSLRFTYSVAGHPPPLLGLPDGRVEHLTARGLPLGIVAEPEYSEEFTFLVPGSLLAFYTDGLIEVDRDIEQGERVAEQAVADEIASPSPDPAEAIVRRIVVGAPKDDIALLTVSLAPHALEQIDLSVAADPQSLRMLRQTLRRLALTVGLNEEESFKLLVACGEALSNVIEHAYGAEDGMVRLKAHCDEHSLVIEIKDQGRWRIPRNEGRGRGIVLMRELMTSVDISSSDSGTTVRLVKSLQERENDRAGQLPQARV